MSRGTILTSCLVLNALASLIGGLLKILHWPGAGLVLLLALGALLVFVVLAASEVITATRLSGSLRVLWLLVLLAGGFFGGLLYLLVGRPGAARAAD